MDERICFRVILSKAGWSARFDGHGALHHFQTRAQAVDSAREAAKTRWEVLGKRSCVQVQEVDGQLLTEVEFG